MKLEPFIPKILCLFSFFVSLEAGATGKTILPPTPTGKNCEMTITYVAKSERVITKTFWKSVNSEEECKEWVDGHRDNMTPAVTKSKSVQARYVK